MRLRAIAGTFLLLLPFACGDDDAAEPADAPDGGASTSSSGGTSSGDVDPDGGATDPDAGDEGGAPPPDPPGPYTGPSRSCTQKAGGRTCGAKGDDDCCKSIAVPKPGAAFALDKYNITAGRMRAMITATNGDVRGYLQAHRPDWWEPSWDAMVPIELDDGTVVKGANHVFDDNKGFDGVYQQLGPIHWGKEGPGNEGCLTKQIGNARTYRLPDDVNKDLFDDVQQYSQEILDTKSLQCVTWYMVAAFCAWDGGRLPTLDELNFAFDGGEPAKHKYPWGNTPAPAGWNSEYDSAADAKEFGKVQPAGGDQTFANYRYNFFEPAKKLCVGTTSNCDYSLYIAPPGRFPKGDGPFGHSDLVGNVYNVAWPLGGAPGSDPRKRTAALARIGAFDGHAIPTTHPAPDNGKWNALQKYLAVGGRCARVAP